MMPRRTRPLPRKRGDKISMNALYKREKGICCRCEQPVPRLEATKEHKNPKAYGGRNGFKFSNIGLAHEYCNRKYGSERGWVA